MFRVPNHYKVLGPTKKSLTFSGCRIKKCHIYLSLLIEHGGHSKFIQEQAGHSSIQVAMDIYGHLFPDRDRGLADKLDDVRTGAGYAPALHPEGEEHEQGSDKSRKLLVAVPRIERGTRGL